MLWILPTPAVPWIGRYDGVIDDEPMGAHKCAARPTLPLAHRFGFGESQHFQPWSRRLDFNQRSPPYRTGALNTWLRRQFLPTVLQAQQECNEKTMIPPRGFEPPLKRSVGTHPKTWKSERMPVWVSEPSASPEAVLA